MKFQRLPNSNGIDDLKLIGETDQERLFIQQLAAAGTLTTVNKYVSGSAVFKAISAGSNESVVSHVKPIAVYNFVVKQNQDHAVELTFKENGEPQDLSQFQSIKLQVRKNLGGVAVFEISLDNGLEILGDDNNVLKLSFTAAQTALLSTSNYEYDVLMITSARSHVYYLKGTINVESSITR